MRKPKPPITDLWLKAQVSVWARIATFLDLRDLCHLRAVCRTTRLAVLMSEVAVNLDPLRYFCVVYWLVFVVR